MGEWTIGKWTKYKKGKTVARKYSYVHNSAKAQTQLQLIFSETSLYIFLQMQHFWLG